MIKQTVIWNDQTITFLEFIFVTEFSYNSFICSCQTYLLHPPLSLSFKQSRTHEISKNRTG